MCLYVLACVCVDMYASMCVLGRVPVYVCTYLCGCDFM
jgi:hypothetical protein